MKSYSFFLKDSSLDPTEKGILNYIESAIGSKDAVMLDKVNKALMKYESDLILKLCKASNKFSNYCQTDEKFHKVIITEC